MFPNGISLVNNMSETICIYNAYLAISISISELKGWKEIHSCFYLWKCHPGNEDKKIISETKSKELQCKIITSTILHFYHLKIILAYGWRTLEGLYITILCPTPNITLLFKTSKLSCCMGKQQNCCIQIFYFWKERGKRKKKTLSKICLSVLCNNLLAQPSNMHKAKFKTL